MNEELFKLIKEKFQAKLSQKTGWGRNEIMAAYDQAVAEAAIQFIDQQKGK